MDIWHFEEMALVLKTLITNGVVEGLKLMILMCNQTHALTQPNKLERVQKRAVKIILGPEASKTTLSALLASQP